MAERRQLSPVREALRVRQRLLEQAALGWIDGAHIDVDHLASGEDYLAYQEAPNLLRWSHALENRLKLADFEHPQAVIDWLGFGPDRYDVPRYDFTRDYEEILSLVESWRSKVDWRQAPLLVSAGIATQWRTLRPLGQNDALAAVLLGDRWGAGRSEVSMGGLTAIGLQALGARG